MSMFKIASAAAVLVVGYAAFASTAEASATSKLNKCRFDTKQKVVECCERVLQDKKKPLWMVETGGNCNTVAKCVKKSRGRGTLAITYVPAKPKLKCFIDMKGGGGNDGGKNPQEPPRQPPTRDINITHGKR